MARIYMHQTKIFFVMYFHAFCWLINVRTLKYIIEHWMSNIYAWITAVGQLVVEKFYRRKIGSICWRFVVT